MPRKKAAKKKDAFGYSEMVWAETLDPEYARVREELRRVAVNDGALSIKVKEMIVIGILAARGLQYGVAAHMRRAVAHGATRQELFEALKAAHVPGGGMAYSVGIRALQELELEGTFKEVGAPRRAPQKTAAKNAVKKAAAKKK
jgi:AhpD family alkylhydroperoxidase